MKSFRHYIRNRTSLDVSTAVIIVLGVVFYVAAAYYWPSGDVPLWVFWMGLITLLFGLASSFYGFRALKRSKSRKIIISIAINELIILPAALYALYAAVVGWLLL